MIENTKLQDESFAKFVLEDNSRANKRKDIIFLFVILALISFCFYKEYKYQQLLKSMSLEQSTTYTADMSEGSGNAIINDNGGEVNINSGEGYKENNKKNII